MEMCEYLMGNENKSLPGCGNINKHYQAKYNNRHITSNTHYHHPQKFEILVLCNKSSLKLQNSMSGHIKRCTMYRVIFDQFFYKMKGSVKNLK